MRVKHAAPDIDAKHEIADRKRWSGCTGYWGYETHVTKLSCVEKTFGIPKGSDMLGEIDSEDSNNAAFFFKLNNSVKLQKKFPFCRS